MVCHEMMDIMAALPPPERESATEVGNKQADERIHGKDVRDGKVSRIMCGEHDLMLHGMSADIWGLGMS
jgi:hypothetical protein